MRVYLLEKYNLDCIEGVGEIVWMISTGKQIGKDTILFAYPKMASDDRGRLMKYFLMLQR